MRSPVTMNLFVLLASGVLPLVTAATVELNWNVTWVLANPDGLLVRPVMGINGQWPLPMLNVTTGDRIIAHIENGLGNQTTTMHWHGIFQNGTNQMDGPSMVTQCEIPPGSSVTYDFTLNQTGTYWYHSHTMAQYPDGLRQGLLITDPDNPFAGQYDEERFFTFSDWYHDQMPALMQSFVSYENPTGAEPIPDSALINDTALFTLDVQPGKTYLLRMVNIGAFASSYFWIEGHNMTIVEVDGVWVQPTQTDMIYITPAQRYSVLVTMLNDTSTNYPMVSSMDTDLFDVVPPTLNWNATGYIVYNQTAELPPATDLDEFDPYDDFYLVPLDGEEILGDADYTVTLEMIMGDLGNGANYAFFNGISYVQPKVPTLYSVLSAGPNASDVAIYGMYSNPFVLEYGDTIDIVLNNDDTGKHPFHLHGHTFQAIARSDEDEGHWNGTSSVPFPSVPVRRDTFMVRPGGYFVIRFRADNPGVWFFHCHIEWHMATGLAATMIEAPLELQKAQGPINDEFAQMCQERGMPTTGNAAGNSVDFFDLTGQNEPVAPLPDGFTARGYVALVFSCVSGVLGLATIAWYGAVPISGPSST